MFQGFIDGVDTLRGREVVNSIVPSKKIPLLHAWKRKVAIAVSRSVNGPVRLDSAAVSLSFVFCPSNLPVVDGAALGLFAESADILSAGPGPSVQFG